MRPGQGLGPAPDTLQYTLGDGPTLEAAQHGRILPEPDLPAAGPARRPLFLPAAVRTELRAVIATPLGLGAAVIGVPTGYRTCSGPPGTARLRSLERPARTLLPLLCTEPTTPADGTGPDPGLRLYRAEVHRATGFPADELGTSPGRALLCLRAHAAAHDRPLAELARGFLTRRHPRPREVATT
ncbi:hypothetical protein [Streptomyces sp. V3I8]|uniref:hypothetical protein n=1 Tax=Streptomyces sp. V3I8 TaxID=3042279 RepID=UPI0027D778BC|nr:hypothetical protein [Streptomyces sp. V3I8]